MTFIVVDVEADGPIPAEFSMVCFGAVLFDEALDKSFYGQPRPVSDRFVPEALAVSGFSREQHVSDYCDICPSEHCVDIIHQALPLIFLNR